MIGIQISSTSGGKFTGALIVRQQNFSLTVVCIDIVLFSWQITNIGSAEVPVRGLYPIGISLKIGVCALWGPHKSHELRRIHRCPDSLAAEFFSDGCL